MSDIYYTVEDEGGESRDKPTLEEAMRLAKEWKNEGHVCVHVFKCRDDEDGEPVFIKTIC